MSRGRRDERRLSDATKTLMTPQMRSQRLIGNSNPRYSWEQYYKTDDELAKMKKPLRQYYEKNNLLIQQYIYIDKLLDSSLPYDLIQEYSQPTHSQNGNRIHIPSTIRENSNPSENSNLGDDANSAEANGHAQSKGKLKRTPRNLYKLPEETTPLITPDVESSADGGLDTPPVPLWEVEDGEDSGSRIVKVAIYVNLAANTLLLILKIVAMLLTSSLSVLASLVDAALDFLSTAIVWTTSRLVSQKDRYKYPVGRRRLEPVGVLVFSVIMITSFFQVALEGLKQMASGAQEIVVLPPSAIAVMVSTIVIKLACWFWCRLIKNSSVQALAQDAMTDVVFNTFSIIFPLGKLPPLLVLPQNLTSLKSDITRRSGGWTRWAAWC